MLFAILFSALILGTSPLAPSGGLGFHGLERPIDERTSLRVSSGAISVRDSLSVTLQLKSFPEQRYGQVLRINLLGKSDSPAIILLYDGFGQEHVFQAIWEGHRIIARSSIPIQESDSPSVWIPLTLKADLADNTVSLKVGSKEAVSGEVDLPGKLHPIITFGRDGERTDVPSMALKEINIKYDSRKPRHFPLNETEGNTVHAAHHFTKGTVTNPVWLSRNSYLWRKILERKSSSYQCAGYNSYEHELYLFDKDSAFFLSPNTPSGTRMQGFAQANPVQGVLGSSFVNPMTHEITVYEPYYQDVPSDEEKVTMASFDKDGKHWTELSTWQFPLHMHHHNCVVDSVGHRVIVYGGFGRGRYNGDFFSFSLDSLSWRKLPPLNGPDPLWPRFQGSMGLDPESGALYIYGGMGNESGEQIVGHQYFYTLHKVDLATGECHKLWEIPWKGPNTVAVRNMVFDGEGHFYTLLYTESITESALHLYRFNISDGKFTILADPIPIYSDRISCQANLYLDRERKLLTAIVEESTDDISSTVKAWTLDFPPGANIVKASFLGRSPLALKIAVALLLAMVLIFLILRTIRSFMEPKTITPLSVKSKEYGANSITLFGDFSAMDRNGANVSAHFSGKIRQLLFLLLEGQEKGGVTSTYISSQLWPEKEYLQAKNIRGVTINSLRKSLSEMDGIQLEFHSGRYTFNLGKEFSCDYLDFLSMLSSEKPDMDRILGILARGNILQSENDPMFDKMKNHIESLIEPLILSEMPRRYSMRQFLNTILCSNILFRIDPLNEEALRYTVKSLCALEKTEEAKSRYKDFVHRYNTDYQEEFRTSFDELIGQMRKENP